MPLNWNFPAKIGPKTGQEIIDQQTGKSYDIVTMTQQGLLAGTDPSSPNYWGDIHDDDQRIVEAADIARVL